MYVLTRLYRQRTRSDQVVDEPNVYVDAPINLQVVAPRFNHGLVLAALNVVVEIIGQ